jgi:myo-inositol-1(or 4)-monophosphatase
MASSNWPDFLSQRNIAEHLMSQDLVGIVHPIAVEAGAVALQYFRQADALGVETKGYLDLVTAADRAVEKLLVERLRAQFPEDGVIGEEGASAPSRSGRVWVVDPIDGTFNFVRGSDQWSISIGLFDGSRPVFGMLNLPAQNRIVVGGEGIVPAINGQPLGPLPKWNPNYASVALGFGPASTDHRASALVQRVADAGLAFRYCGSGSVSLLSLAMGQVDGYASLAESSWDIMGAMAILEAMGAVHSIDWSVLNLSEKTPLLCGTPAFFDLTRDFTTCHMAPVQPPYR